MVVVPYRPWHKAGIFCLFLLSLGAFSWLTYQYGMDQGLATRVEVIKERDQIKGQLKESLRLIDAQRQQIADLKVGGQIDSRANEEVRQTVESLQNQVAELNEEIRFYKGVMLPNVEEKGLRIERLDLRAGTEPNKVKYSLLLTQVVDKHDYIQGGVQINLVGTQGDTETILPIDQVSDATNNIRFRFRYFQNIDGEVTLPPGFVPKEIKVVAQASGGPRLERNFEWQTGEG